jgi:hypothetical protein
MTGDTNLIRKGTRYVVLDGTRIQLLVQPDLEDMHQYNTRGKFKHSPTHEVPQAFSASNALSTYFSAKHGFP